MADPIQPMNTTQILLSLNKKLFSDEPDKISDNNQLLRLFTYLDTRAATDLGSKIQKLPNVFRDQERAETVINKFRAAKTEGAIKAFNLFVDEIQDPSNKSTKYSEQLAVLKKAFNDFVSDLRTEMETLLPKSLSDSQIKPYLGELKKHDQFTQLSSDTKTLEREGSILHEQFVKLTSKAEITLIAVAPDVAMTSKATPGAQKPSEPPSTLANE
ncbi:MAG: hypothetical protein V4501_11475 [Pseudomonadota bacterium]